MSAFDYVTVGHVTVDIDEHGARQPGGGAFYSALQASRLGLRSMIVTCGQQSELSQLLEPYRHELSLNVAPAEHTTKLASTGQGDDRRQRLLSWAGPIESLPDFESDIVHLAPVVRELSPSLLGAVDERFGSSFVGLTPQGLVRSWSSISSQLEPAELAWELMPEHYDAAVISQAERASCSRLFDELPCSGAIVAVTDGAHPVSLHSAVGTLAQADPRATDAPVDDLGAGDVFAAAFFHRLREGASPQRAAGFANDAAAVRIAGEGPAAIGTRLRIENHRERPL